MSTNKVRGVLQNQEIRHNNWRDSRTFGEKFSDSLEKPNSVFMIIITLATIMVIYPTWLEPAFIIGMLLFYYISKKRIFLPFRMPASSGLIDYNTPVPAGKGGTTYKQGKGIIFLGNEMGTRKELWLTDSDAKTHFLIFGSTGAGKALRNKELILTPHGWVKNEDIKVGDYVMRPNGEWSKVIGVYPQGLDQLYELILEDERTIKITGEHLWEVFNHKKITEKQEGRVLNTISIQNGIEKEEEFSIRTVGRIEQNKVNLSKSLDDLVYESVLASLRNNDFESEVSTIINGSYSQREYFFNQYKNQMKKQYGFSLDHFTSTFIGFKQKGNAEIIMKLAHSLGYYAKLVNREQKDFNLYDLNEKLNYFVYIKNVDFIKIKEVKATKEFEDCQCIKIEHEDGLFVTKDYIVTHNTETLLSLAYNTLVHGSGFIYVDGKGDNSLAAKIFSLLRSLGREDDLLTLNYMTGSRDVSGPQENKLSNTLNPLTSGTSNGLTELIVGLMGGGGGGGDDLWKGRAIALISAVMRALVWKRDHSGLLLDVEKLRDYLILENIQKLAEDTELPLEVVSSLNAYLLSLPGYVAGSTKQSDTVFEQHGYLQMQFTRILGSLSDDYGYIFKTNLGEIDFKDVILNNRILCVLLPALEKSIDELANLGKIVIACLKIMMSAGLGDSLEGTSEKLLNQKATNSPSPYMCILDEYGYYVVTGAAVMPAQARSLGFSMVFAGQDYPSFKKNNNSEEASATIGNCNVKIFMKVEDPGDTYELFHKSAGEAVVARTTQQERSSGGLTTGYFDTPNISMNKEARGNLLDLKDQTEGQGHIIFKSTIVRASMFYANPEIAKNIRLNHFIKIEPPTKSEMEQHAAPISNLDERLKDRQYIEDIMTSKEDVNIRMISAIMKELESKSNLNVNEIFAATIAASIKNNDERINEFNDEVDYEDDDNEQMSIYKKDGAETDEEDESYNVASSKKAFSELFNIKSDENEDPFLSRKKLNERVREIESHSSIENEEERKRSSENLINDLEEVSVYPKTDIPTNNHTNKEEILKNIDLLLKDTKG